MTLRVVRGDGGEQQRERGVYWAWYTERGCRVLLAVDRWGEKVASRRVRKRDNEERVVEEMWAALDRLDPEPTLRVATGTDGRLPLSTAVLVRLIGTPAIRAPS